MGWLVSILESIFSWTFQFLVMAQHGPWIVFWTLICVGLLYWMVVQQKYNRQAEADPNQLK